jgi:hypothetical protein
MYNPNQLHRTPVWYRAAGPLRARGNPARSPRGQDRAERIRLLFLKELAGRAEIDELRVACLQAGLLEGVRHESAQRNLIRAAISTIAAPGW